MSIGAVLDVLIGLAVLYWGGKWIVEAYNGHLRRRHEVGSGHMFHGLTLAGFCLCLFVLGVSLFTDALPTGKVIALLLGLGLLVAAFAVWKHYQAAKAHPQRAEPWLHRAAIAGLAGFGVLVLYAGLFS